MNQQLLILGKPKSSKTTFLAQFVTIARKSHSSIKFWKTPENIQPILDAITRLRKGEETQTTPADSNLVIKLPVSMNGIDFELSCPDYGGEQINTILEQREIDSNWSQQINSSSSWILFIRPQSIQISYDLSNKSSSESNPKKNRTDDVEEDFKISEQSDFIELLQFMLALKKISFQKEITIPKLTIALTCWDEIDPKIKPLQHFASTLPLLNQFLRSNWSADSFKIMGISAQGFELKTSINKDKYLDEGPEKFPFVVKGDSIKRIYDLTLLIAEAL